MTIFLANNRLAEVLLVEDNENDVELTRQSFKRSKILLNLHHTKDGVECLAFLRKQREYSKAPTPDLILLDLNMPRKDGRQVMAEIMADEGLRVLPVIILSTSRQSEEILAMYRLGCNSYIVKPVSFQQFLDVARTVAEYWFGFVVLPTGLPFETSLATEKTLPDD